MRAVYIGRYYMADSHNLSLASVSMPILERKRIKILMKSITNNVIKFSEVDYDNVKMAYELCKYFMKETDISANVLQVTHYYRSEYCKILFKLIQLEYEKYGKEPLRVYIPYDKNKSYLHTLRNMIKKRKINAEIEEIKYEESCYQQIASVLAGCIYYHEREDLYFLNLGKTGQAQLVAYVYSTKKPKNKLNIYNYSLLKNQAAKN